MSASPEHFDFVYNLWRVNLIGELLFTMRNVGAEKCLQIGLMLLAVELLFISTNYNP